MQILIKKCSDSRLWYANQIGKRATLVRTYVDAYLVVDPEGYTNYVHRDDADVVQEDRS